MTEAYRVAESKVIAQSHQLEKLLLEACDSDTRTFLRLAEINIWPCGTPSKPTLMIACKSREVTEAIGVRQAYIKSVLKRLMGCNVVITLYYHIPEGLVYFDTEGEVAPARWYLCNRKECGKKAKIPLPG